MVILRVEADVGRALSECGDMESAASIVSMSVTSQHTSTRIPPNVRDQRKMSFLPNITEAERIISQGRVSNEVFQCGSDFVDTLVVVFLQRALRGITAYDDCNPYFKRKKNGIGRIIGTYKNVVAAGSL